MLFLYHFNFAFFVYCVLICDVVFLLMFISVFQIILSLLFVVCCVLILFFCCYYVRTLDSVSAVAAVSAKRCCYPFLGFDFIFRFMFCDL